MLVYRGEQAFGVGDVADVVAHGLSLDLSTALYFFIVPLLMAVATIWVSVPRWLYKAYVLLLSVAFALAFVADTSLYAFWKFKLDASCLQYLDTPTEAMASVSTGYLAVRLLVFGLVAFLVYWLYSRLALPQKRGRWHEAIVYALLVPVVIIGIRGGLDESTTNIGQVYYSPNQFLNHSAVNPVFSFLSSFEKTASYVPDYQFMSDADCERALQGLFPTESIGTDTLLNTTRPNVVVILMESCGGMFTKQGGRADIMPRLNRLMDEGVYFANCYANSWRTDRGTVCTYSGYPSFPTSSIMKMPSKTRLMPSIASSLKAEGYTTHYLYGGDINFTNMRSYLVATGFDRLTWKKDYTPEEQNTNDKWGVRDDITFETLLQMILDGDASGRPFLIGYSTLSSHEPWVSTMQKFDDPIPNAFYFLDHCIGQFVDKVSKTPAWDNLLVVLLPDHSITYKDIDETRQLRNRIPMVWIGGAVKAPRRIEAVCNQTDLPATLLGQMGIAHRQFRFSRDVASRNYTSPVAFHTFNNGLSAVDSTGFAVYDLDSRRLTVDESPRADLLITRSKALLQTATRELKNLQPHEK